jgi:hypothetical protein
MKTLFPTLLTILSALSLTGCSLIGFAIGAASDSAPPMAFTPYTPLENFSEGSRVAIVTTSGDTIEGEFAGRRENPEYEKEYHDRISGTPLADVVPAPRTKVTVVAHHKVQLLGSHQYRFQASVRGFDPGVVDLLPLNSSASPVFLLSDLDSLVNDGGHVISISTLAGGLKRREIPYLSQIGIKDTLETHWIPADGFTLIIDRSPRNGTLTGFLIGAAMDAAALVAIRSGMVFSWRGSGF